MDGLSLRPYHLLRWLTTFLLLLGTACAGYPSELTRDSLTPLQLDALDSPATGYHWWQADNPQAVVLVVHGLNLRPTAMNDIASHLQNADMDVLTISLSGHAVELDEDSRLVQFREADFSVWQADVARGVALAHARATETQLPLYMVGFSLGGLLSADYVSRQAPLDDIQVDRMVLFAPAIVLRWSSYALMPFQVFPDVFLPSVAPELYRANNYAPASAYLTLYDGVRLFRESVQQSLNVPTLLFMNPRDELVSDNGLQDFIEDFGLDRWQYIEVQKSAGAGATLDHLIIGPHSLGEESWRQVSDQMVDFLEQPYSGSPHPQLPDL